VFAVYFDGHFSYISYKIYYRHDMITTINEFRKMNENSNNHQLLNTLREKFPAQFSAVEKEKGLEWIKTQIQGRENDANVLMATVVYYHFLESESGQAVWADLEQTDEKVDEIMEEIYNTYVNIYSDDDISFTITENEYEAMSIELHDQVWNGVY
jgi:uncharacterized protein (DUF2249 family)